MEEFFEYFFYYVSIEEIVFVLIVSISFFLAYLIYFSGEKYGETLETAVNKARSGEELTKKENRIYKNYIRSIERR